jgi:hypothetical protein
MSGEGIRYLMRNSHLKIPVPYNRDILVEYADFILFSAKGQGETYAIERLSLPCRSNLYQLLLGLLYHGDHSFQGDIPIKEDDVRFLRVILKNQKDYSFWKEGLDTLRKQGLEKGWEWVRENVSILELRNRLKSKD